MERLDEWMLEPLELEQKAPSLGNEFNISVAFLSHRFMPDFLC